MKTIWQSAVRAFLAFALAVGASGIGRADDSENENIAPESNRWAIFIDASSETSEENAAALEEFRASLIESGIPEKNAPVYSASASDPEKRPTRETIEAIVVALRNPDKMFVWPGETEKRRLRDGDGVCEAQVYLTGLGVANEENGETFFAPAGVAESEIKGWNDSKLFSLKKLEDALLFPEEEQKPIERTFFIVALNSPAPPTRDAFGKVSRRLNGADVKRLPTRGAGNNVDSAKFARFRVATKNARFDDRLVGSFYSTLRDGLNGSADVAGNQDGTVSAEELATYLETTARGNGETVAVERNGNDSYPLCASQKEAAIPDGIFDEIAKSFDNPKNARIKKSAEERARRQLEKKTLKNVDAEENSNGVIVK